MNDEVLISFLQGTGQDSHGRYHSDILKFNDEELENSHNYIQWLFPLREPSEVVPESPFLESDAVIEMLRQDETVQESLVTALIRMHQFYEDNDFWLKQGDHNHLRITRILKSITLLNTRENARDFYDFILRRVESAKPVTDESLKYWKESLGE